MVNYNMTHIAVIGNGFDLSQGLRTSYTDFIKSTQFQNLLGSTNDLADYLYAKHELQLWIDIENELTKYSSSPSAKNGIAFQDNFNAICTSLKDYLSTISYDNIDSNTHSYKMIKNLVGQDFCIFDFNYTETTEVILKDLGVSSSDINNRLIKVHGSLKETNIIFGVEDKAKIKQEHVFLRKAYNPHYKSSLGISSFLEKAEKIYFFGHSLGNTDHMYFQGFFHDLSLLRKNKEIILYHYKEDSYRKLLGELDVLTMQNLSKFKQNNRFTTIDTSK